MNKLSIKFSLLTGVISFLISLGVGQYANNISTSQLETNSGESLLKLSRHVADILDREMLERYREIKFASTLSVMTDKNSSKELKREFINKIKNNYNHHRWIGYALPDGTVDVGSDGYLEGKNVKGRPWHPAGLKGPYIGDVHDALLLARLLPNVSGEPIYFSDVAFPVKDKEGKTLGVLCTHLNWQWTRDVIRSIEKENSVDIFLLSQSDLVLVGPGNSERKELKEISKNVVERFKNTQTPYKIINWKAGEKYLTAQTISKGFDEYKGFGWKVIVRQPVDKAFAIARHNSKNIFIASIAAGIIGALIGMLFTRRISSPLNRLNELVKKLNEGEKVDFKDKFPNDEIGSLYKTLKNLYDGMEKESKLKKMAQEKVDIALKVFDQSIEGVLISDENNKIVLTNRSFTQITGYSPEEVYGKNPNYLSSGNTSETFYLKMWEDIKEKGKWEGDIQNKRKNGSLYEEHLKISTLKDENGRIIYYVATFNSSF